MTPEHVALLKSDEGFQSKPYLDTVGVETIGYGTNLRQGITEEQAAGLMECELADNARELESLPWYVDLDTVRQGVIDNMAYNIGVNGVLGFKNMIANLEIGAWQAASDAMLDSKWATQVPNRAHRLAGIIVSGAMPK